ncbi:MAG: 3-hydroxyacyl-ACP dehydratase FabZ family protein [Phycisphaerales bacterium]
MSAVRHQSDPPVNAGDDSRGIKPVIDLARLDLTKRMYSRDDIAKLNPHRGEMALLDWIIWETPDHRQVVGLKHIRHDEFWVPGHFPAKAMFPGVLMIEAGAQLACFSFNIRQPAPKVIAFLRIEEASFRASVHPGDDLYLLCVEIKYGRRQFHSQIQGMVNDRLAFDARISGMSLPA